MNIADCLKLADELTSVSSTPQLDIEIFLTEILTCSRAELKAYPEKKLSWSEARQLNKLIARRKAGEPVAYLVGHQPFWTLELIVTPETLIPRPETEHLIEWVLQGMPSVDVLRVADLGVGSGALALALAKERPLWQIDATDISAAALNVAEKNRVKHAIENVTFYQGAWCEALPQRRYDLIVSNPPYISAEDPHLAQLRYEPKGALVAEKNGLAALEDIIEQSQTYLNSGGSLVLEHGYNQSEAVADLLKKAGYHEIDSHKDYGGNLRFSTAKWERACK